MGKRCGSDGASYRIYEFGEYGTRRIVELTSRSRGDRLVRAGVAEQALDWDGVTICYRVKRDARAVRSALGMHDCCEITSAPSSAALSRAEVDAVAGTNFKYGKSRTAGLSEDKKMARLHPKTHRVLPPEDIVERATAKLQAWARVGPAIAALSQ